jgi:hypothetical protein
MMHKPIDWDLCTLTAGRYDSSLTVFFAKNSHLYLSTQRNKPSLALNIAIKSVQWHIGHAKSMKIFLLQRISNLKTDYMRIKAQVDYGPGAVAPVLNINGVTSRIFIKEMNLLSAHQPEFNEKLISCEDVNIHHNPDAAKWIWDKSPPLDITAKRFSNTDAYTLFPTRFSIGAILFEREFGKGLADSEARGHPERLKRMRNTFVKSAIIRPDASLHRITHLPSISFLVRKKPPCLIA